MTNFGNYVVRIPRSTSLVIHHTIEVFVLLPQNLGHKLYDRLGSRKAYPHFFDESLHVPPLVATQIVHLAHAITFCYEESKARRPPDNCRTPSQWLNELRPCYLPCIRTF